MRDRTARFELTEREVNRALLEAECFQKRADWPEALEAVKRAEGFLAVGAPEPPRRRVRERRDDVDTVLRLEDIRLPRTANTPARKQRSWKSEYAAAFRNYGIEGKAPGIPK